MSARALRFSLQALVATCVVLGLAGLGGRGAMAAEPTGPAIHLPVLHDLGSLGDCRAELAVQSLGCEPSKALLLLWGAPGACPPQCAGPLRVACSGLLAPGSTWTFPDHEIPSTARTGVLFGITARNLFELSVAPEPVLADRATADYVCQVLFFSVVGNCHGYRRFKQAYDAGARWSGIDLGAARGAPLAAEVRQACMQRAPSELESRSAYAGLAADRLGRFDPLFGGYAQDLPLLQADDGGMNSRVHLHNAGAECSSISLWLAGADRCNRARICTVDQLAPGESASVDVADCVGGGWRGSGWIRSSQPLAVVVATSGEVMRASYIAHPQGLTFAVDGSPSPARSTVLHAPLAFSASGGWSTGLQLQNRSGVRTARVRLDFVDASGAVAASLTDWICPRGSRSYFLPLVSDLPLAWRGAVRVESLPVGLPGAPAQEPVAIAGVARAVRHADAARTQAVEAASHALLAGPEAGAEAPCGPEGSGCAGMIALPELRKTADVGGGRSELAVTNLVGRPGTTDMAVYLFDENGLVDFLCLRLPERQSAYVDLDVYAFLRSGFVGGAVVSAVAWRHGPADEVWADARPIGHLEQAAGSANAPALAALVLQRNRATSGELSPNDGAFARLGVPVFEPRLACESVTWPQCPVLSP